MTMTSEQTQEQYRSKIKEVAEKAVHYVETDNGWYPMRDAFNELAEESGANKGINRDVIIGRRKLLVQSVCIECISKLSREANDWLEDQLNDIAEEYAPRQRSRLR